MSVTHHVDTCCTVLSLTAALPPCCLQIFRSGDGSKALYSLVYEDSRRAATLSVLARHRDQQNFADMMAILQYQRGQCCVSVGVSSLRAHR